EKVVLHIGKNDAYQFAARASQHASARMWNVSELSGGFFDLFPCFPANRRMVPQGSRYRGMGNAQMSGNILNGDVFHASAARRTLVVKAESAGLTTQPTRRRAPASCSMAWQSWVVRICGPALYPVLG